MCVEERDNRRIPLTRRQRAEGRRQLAANGPIRIAQVLQYGGVKRMIQPGQPPLRETDRRRAHVARLVIQRPLHVRRLDRIDSVQRPQRVKPHAPVGGGPGQVRKRRNRRPRSSFDDQALRRVAPPAVRMRQRRDQLRR